MTTSITWFRRDLRLSDNPALVDAVRSADDVVGVFCLDGRARDEAVEPALADAGVDLARVARRTPWHRGASPRRPARRTGSADVE